MTNWIISANPNIYDYSSSFEHYKFVDWRQVNPNFEIGDIVFIYSNRPLSMIQYKCLVQDVNLRYPNIRDDKEYFFDPKEYQRTINGNIYALAPRRPGLQS